MTESEMIKSIGMSNIAGDIKEEGQLRRSERKKIPSLWYIEHLNEYKKTVSKKNPGFDTLDKSPCSSELSSPFHTHYLPFVQVPNYYDLQGNETKTGLVAFLLKSRCKRSKELNRSKILGKGIQKLGISKKKPQRKFHQTYSSINRQKNHKYEKKSIGNVPIGNPHKKADNILDMILSAAMKVKKDPSSTEPHHKMPMKMINELEEEKRNRGHNRNEIKDRTLDNGFIKKSIKKNGKLIMEHSNKGNVEIDFIEKKDPNFDLNYGKLFKSKLFENCFNYEKETLNNLQLEESKLEAIAKEKLQELKDSFKEMKKSSLIFT